MLDQLLAPSAAGKLAEPVLIAGLQLAVDVNRAAGRFEAALNYARQWRGLLNREAEASGRSLNAQRQAAALAIADLQMSLNRSEEAEKTLEQAIKLPEGARLGDPLWEADAQVRLARAIGKQAEEDRKIHTLLSARSAAAVIETPIERQAKEQWSWRRQKRAERSIIARRRKPSGADCGGGEITDRMFAGAESSEEAATVATDCCGMREILTSQHGLSWPVSWHSAVMRSENLLAEREALEKALVWQKRVGSRSANGGASGVDESDCRGVCCGRR